MKKKIEMGMDEHRTKFEKILLAPTLACLLLVLGSFWYFVPNQVPVAVRNSSAERGGDATIVFGTVTTNLAPQAGISQIMAAK